MKKLIYLLSIAFLMFQSCSSGDSDNNTNTTTVSDIDGNVYQTVTICNQTWTKTNLNVSRYRNGDVIPQVTNPSAWANLTTGAWCYYNNDPANGAIYGKLYNWYAVNDPRGIAPSGYHIPTDAEWTSLISCLGGESVAGGKMKETGTTHWINFNTSATNSSGFTGLPGGGRFEIGSFIDITANGSWWSSSELIPNYAWHVTLYADLSDAVKDYRDKTIGYSIRCIKN